MYFFSNLTLFCIFSDSDGKLNKFLFSCEIRTCTLNVKSFHLKSTLSLALFLELPFAVWAASVCLHFHPAVYSVALFSSVRLYYTALVWILISLPFIHLFFFCAGDIRLLFKLLFKFQEIIKARQRSKLLCLFDIVLLKKTFPRRWLWKHSKCCSKLPITSRNPFLWVLCRKTLLKGKSAIWSENSVMYNNVIKTEFLGHILRHKNSVSPQRSSTMLSFLVKKNGQLRHIYKMMDFSTKRSVIPNVWIYRFRSA